MKVLKKYARVAGADKGLKDPLRMTREEFGNPPVIKAKPGYRLAYHYTTSNDVLKKIAREGLKLSSARGHDYQEPDFVWGYLDKQTRVAPWAIFQVPIRGDDSVRFVAGDTIVQVLRDVKPKDIVWVNMAYRKLGKNLLEMRQSRYSDSYYDMVTEEVGMNKRAERIAAAVLRKDHGKFQTYDGVDNLDALKELMQRDEFMDGKPRVVSVTFGQAYVTKYQSPSRIPYTVMGDPPASARGYWKNGKLHKFPEKQWIKYQNTGLGWGR